jgi:hypothetical protein
MARKKKLPNLRPQLTRFMLVGMTAENQLAKDGGSGRVAISRENDIDIETIAPESGSESCRAVVRMNVTIRARREKDVDPALTLKGWYEGRFVFPVGISMDEVDAAAGKEEFQYLLTAQVYPLVMAHMKEQLVLMGLSSQRMPLGV